MEHIHEEDGDRRPTGPVKRPSTGDFPYSQPRIQHLSHFTQTRHNEIAVPRSKASRPWPLFNPAPSSSSHPAAGDSSSLGSLAPGSGLRSSTGAALSRTGDRGATIPPQRPGVRRGPLSILSAEQHRRDEELLRLITSPARHQPGNSDRANLSLSSAPRRQFPPVPDLLRDPTRPPSVAAPRPDRTEERRRRLREVVNSYAARNTRFDPAAMIRMRYPDGGEVVNPGGGSGASFMPSPPPFGTDDGGSPASSLIEPVDSNLSLRDHFTSGPRLSTHGTALTERLSTNGMPFSDPPVEAKKRNVVYKRNSTTPTRDHGDADWMHVNEVPKRAGQADSNGKDKDKDKDQAKRTRLQRTPSKVGVNGTAFSSANQKVEGRRPKVTMGNLSRRTSNESIRSVDSVRGTTVGRSSPINRPHSRSSRIPTAVSSPSPSRPTSSQSVTRKSYSTVSSASDRIPLRSPTPTASHKEQPLSQISPKPRSYIPINHVPRRSLPANGTVKMRQPAPPSFQRSGTSPNSQHFRTVSESLPSKGSIGDDGKHNQNASEEQQAPHEPELRKMAEGVDLGTPTPTRRKRGLSMDSGLRRPATNAQVRNSRRPSMPGSAESTAEIPIPDSLISPSLSDYDELYHLQHGGHPPESPSPLFDRSSGKPNGSSNNRSSLEDEDSEPESLQGALLAGDEEYKSLLQDRGDDEDDTYTLLASTRNFARAPGQVRSRKEVLHADLENARKTETHDKLMNKLKTLHLELRSARRGIDYIERRLNGAASSDDESEWIDEEEAQAIAKRNKEEKAKTETAPKEKAVVEAAPVQEVVEPQPQNSNAHRRWVMFAIQLAILWILLETAVFYRSFPPSVSSVPIEVADIPPFGSAFTRAIISTVFNAANFLVIGVPSWFWGLFIGIIHTVFRVFSAPRIWPGSVSTQRPQSSDMFQTYQSLSADQVVMSQFH